MTPAVEPAPDRQGTFGVEDGPCPDGCQHCAVADQFLTGVADNRPARPAEASRFETCRDDCTTDCGHCKGHGRPTPLLPLSDLLYRPRFVLSPQIPADGAGADGKQRVATPMWSAGAAVAMPFVEPDLSGFIEAMRALAAAWPTWKDDVPAFLRMLETPRQRELREHREKVARREASKDPAARAMWSAYRAKQRRSNRRRNR